MRVPGGARRLRPAPLRAPASAAPRQPGAHSVFPCSSRAGASPRRLAVHAGGRALCSLEGEPPCVHLGRWRGRGGRAGAVLLFGAKEETANTPCAKALLAHPARLLHLVASGPRPALPPDPGPGRAIATRIRPAARAIGAEELPHEGPTGLLGRERRLRGARLATRCRSPFQDASRASGCRGGRASKDRRRRRPAPASSTARPCSASRRRPYFVGGVAMPVALARARHTPRGVAPL